MRGIMFKEDLFRKVVSGEKTQTRRLVKIKEDGSLLTIHGLTSQSEDPLGLWCYFDVSKPNKRFGAPARPKYKKGETLYLKEPYYPVQGDWYDVFSGSYVDSYEYKFDNEDPIRSWQNKMFMPARAARYFIEITDVRVEPLRDISHEDVVREGLPDLLRAGLGATEHFDQWIHLWNSINKPPHSWKDNPWVWVYDFKLK